MISHVGAFATISLLLSRAKNSFRLLVILVLLGVTESYVFCGELQNVQLVGQCSLSSLQLFLRPVYAAYCTFPLLCPLIWFIYRAWMAAQFRLFFNSSAYPPSGKRGGAGLEPEMTAASQSSSLSGSDRLSLLQQQAKGRDEIACSQHLREMMRVLRSWDVGASEVVFNLGSLTGKPRILVERPRVSPTVAPCSSSALLRRQERRAQSVAADGGQGVLPAAAPSPPRLHPHHRWALRLAEADDAAPFGGVGCQHSAP